MNYKIKVELTFLDDFSLISWIFDDYSGSFKVDKAFEFFVYKFL